MDDKGVHVLHFTNGMSDREIAENASEGRRQSTTSSSAFGIAASSRILTRRCDHNEFIASRLYRKAGSPIQTERCGDSDPDEITVR